MEINFHATDVLNYQFNLFNKLNLGKNFKIKYDSLELQKNRCINKKFLEREDKKHHLLQTGFSLIEIPSGKTSTQEDRTKFSELHQHFISTLHGQQGFKKIETKESSPLLFSHVAPQRGKRNSFQIVSEAEPKATWPSSLQHQKPVAHEILQIDQKTYLKCWLTNSLLTCWIDPSKLLKIPIYSYLKELEIGKNNIHIFSRIKNNKIYILVYNSLRREAARFKLTRNHENLVWLNGQTYNQLPPPPSFQDWLIPVSLQGTTFFTNAFCHPSHTPQLWSCFGKTKQLLSLEGSTPGYRGWQMVLPLPTMRNLACCLLHTDPQHPPILDFFGQSGTLVQSWAPTLAEGELFKGAHFIKGSDQKVYCALGTQDGTGEHHLSLYEISPLFFAAEPKKDAEISALSELLALLPPDEPSSTS